ncbi:N-acetylneuraminate synthase [Aurantivibrio infirmus]
MRLEKAYIIAEAGVNHNGNPDMAFQLIDAAVDAGADAVKFQTFRADQLVTESAEKAEYQKQTTDSDESQFEMLKKLELSYEVHCELFRYCKEKEIDFLSTAFDSHSLDFLANDIGLEVLKIPSGDITNAPLVLEHARTGCNLIVSTGMATLGEVETVLGVIAFGLLADPNIVPGHKAFKNAFFSELGQKKLKEKVILLHCTTEYPAPVEDINLAAMDTLRWSFGLPIGYSDHSEGIVIPIAAVARGAVLIEKHFTLDRNLNGPDHKASLEPIELKSMIQSIRIVEASLGDGIKGPRPSELKNIEIARKSVVAAEDIPKGSKFSKANLTIKRPGDGLSPMEYWTLLGKKSPRDLKKGEKISE